MGGEKERLSLGKAGDPASSLATISVNGSQGDLIGKGQVPRGCWELLPPYRHLASEVRPVFFLTGAKTKGWL